MSLFSISKSFIILFAFFSIAISANGQGGDFSELDSLKNALAQSKVDTHRLELLQAINRKFRELSPEDLEKYTREGISLASRIGDKSAEANLKMGLLFKSPTTDTDHQVEDILATIKASKDSVSISRFLLNIGVLYLRKLKSPNHEKALTHFFEVLKYDEGEIKMRALSNIAVVYSELEEQDKAIKYLHEAIAVAKNIEDYGQLAKCYSHLSNIYDYTGKLEEQLKYLNLAMSLEKKGVPDNVLASVYVRAGSAYEDTDSSLLFLNKAIALAKKVGNTYMEMEAVRMSAIKLREVGKISEAEDRQVQLMKMAVQEENSQFIRNAFYQGYEIAKAKDDYKKALENYEKYKSWADSIYHTDKNKEIAEAEIKFETEKTELENEKLKETTALLNTQKKLYITLAIVGFLLSALSLFLFFRTQRQNKTIESQNIKLKNLNATKDRFFAIIAHDLRAPVVDFKGITKTIGFLAENNEVERIKQIGKHVDKAANNLSNLLDNLLNWALLQKGSIPYNPEIIDVKSISEEAIGLYKNIALGKDITLENHIPENIEVNADRDSVFTIFSNLINNAIKFTEKGGKVSLSAKSENNKVYVEIKDSGIGIEANQLNNLFQINEEKSKRGTFGEKGTGLGLVLVKDLAEMNKGTVRAYSQLGEGSRFVFDLPENS